MLQRNPTTARHRATRPRTVLVLARLALAGLSLSTLMAVGAVYFNR